LENQFAASCRSFVYIHTINEYTCGEQENTDSLDNHFVIDFVPRMDGLKVVAGGSGHGFKFLPTRGRHVVDRIEGKSIDHLHLWAQETKGWAQSVQQHHGRRKQ
jgi:sarcosine oxidase/L-pipecolate oxidase